MKKPNPNSTEDESRKVRHNPLEGTLFSFTAGKESNGNRNTCPDEISSLENDVATLLPSRGVHAQMRIIGARHKPLRSATSLDYYHRQSHEDHGIRGTIKGTYRHFWTDKAHSKTRYMFKWSVIKHRRGTHQLTHKRIAHRM